MLYQTWFNISNKLGLIDIFNINRNGPAPDMWDSGVSIKRRGIISGFWDFFKIYLLSTGVTRLDKLSLTQPTAHIALRGRNRQILEYTTGK